MEVSAAAPAVSLVAHGDYTLHPLQAIRTGDHMVEVKGQGAEVPAIAHRTQS